MAREEGLRALWKGLVPGLHRQVLLGGVRIASYDPIRDFYARALGEEGGKTSVATKIAAGITAGTLGVLVRGGSAGELRATAQAPALCAPTPLAAPAAAPCFPPQVGNPTDVLKVRMQAQGRLPPGAPPKYPSTLGAYRLIVRQEGLSALWTGTTPNIGARAVTACALQAVAVCGRAATQVAIANHRDCPPATCRPATCSPQRGGQRG